jgi:hypothetical protein
MSAIEQWNPAAFAIEPDSRNARVYEKRYATFRKLYPRIRDLMEELGAGSETEMSNADWSPGAAKQQVPAAAGQADSNLSGKGQGQIPSCQVPESPFYSDWIGQSRSVARRRSG